VRVVVVNYYNSAAGARRSQSPAPSLRHDSRRRSNTVTVTTARTAVVSLCIALRDGAAA